MVVFHSQVFLREEHGDKVLTNKADIWSASITMMHVLEGKHRNKDKYEEVCNF